MLLAFYLEGGSGGRRGKGVGNYIPPPLLPATLYDEMGTPPHSPYITIPLGDYCLNRGEERGDGFNNPKITIFEIAKKQSFSLI